MFEQLVESSGAKPRGKLSGKLTHLSKNTKWEAKAFHLAAKQSMLQ